MARQRPEVDDRAPQVRADPIRQPVPEGGAERPRDPERPERETAGTGQRPDAHQGRPRGQDQREERQRLAEREREHQGGGPDLVLADKFDEVTGVRVHSHGARSSATPVAPGSRSDARRRAPGGGQPSFCHGPQGLDHHQRHAPEPDREAGASGPAPARVLATRGPSRRPQRLGARQQASRAVEQRGVASYALAILTPPPLLRATRGTRHSARTRALCLGLFLVARGWPEGPAPLTLCSASPGAGVPERSPCACASAHPPVGGGSNADRDGKTPLEIKAIGVAIGCSRCYLKPLIKLYLYYQ